MNSNHEHVNTLIGENMGYMKDIEIDQRNKINDIKLSITELMAGGCRPIVQCNECPLSNSNEPNDILMCVTLTHIRKSIPINENSFDEQ